MRRWGATRGLRWRWRECSLKTKGVISPRSFVLEPQCLLVSGRVILLSISLICERTAKLSPRYLPLMVSSALTGKSHEAFEEG
jgi:hypothetical protein